MSEDKSEQHLAR